MNPRDLFINRELSWLDFNDRVLDEARNPRRPVLERLKFLAIFSSNLDEFFMIRVGGLKHRDPDEVSSTEAGDAASTREVLEEIRRRVHNLVLDQYRVLRDEALPELAKSGLQLLRAADVQGDEARDLDAYFDREVMPVLTPIVIDPAHPFPHVQNRHLYLAARLKSKTTGRVRVPKNCLAVLPVPPILPRFVPVSRGEGRDRFVLLEDLIARHLERIFAGFAAVESTVFRLTRDQDFELSDQDSEDLVKQIQTELTKRRRGVEVRLEIGAGASESLRHSLTGWFDLEPRDIYELDGPLNLSAFWAWIGLPGYAALRDAPRTPEIPPRVRANKGDFFSLIRQGDLLLHHPYEPFETVTQFVEQAAQDPDVLAIKQTLYRTGKNSPIVAALARAAERDKQVTALIELKARFDEEANIEWARQLERAGAHVVYGVPGLKTHCKVLLVVRRDPDRIRRYTHLSTGNYNLFTSRLYTDIGLMTCDDRIGEDASSLFNMMTGYAQPPAWKKLVVAPHGLREWIIGKIERETAHAKAGRAARIIVKMNALVDKDVIRALVAASQAGVSIDLVIRGICCLRPGVPGLTENIRVISIVGRYLEHSRIFWVANGGSPEMFLGSADWMPRNFDRRVEVVFPVEDVQLKRRLTGEILAATLNDDANARRLGSDGRYERLAGTFDSHAVLERIAAGAAIPLTLSPPPDSKARKPRKAPTEMKGAPTT